MKAFRLIQAVLLLAATYVTAQDTEKQQMPLFYGWFFNDIIAAGLKNITDGHLNSLYSDVPAVQNFLRKVSNQSQITDPLKYYAKPLDPNTGNFDPFYHITAKYCGGKDCSNYTRQIEKYMKQNFSTDLVGVFFTPRTFGIRVNLSQIQEDIFGMEVSGVAGTDSVTPNLEAIKDYPGIDFLPQDEDNFHPTDSRAHVTLGCAPNVSAVTTGEDLLKILAFEKNETFCGEVVSAEHGNLIQMGTDCDIFVYYLEEKMIANATFDVYYSRCSKTSINLGTLWVGILSIVSLYWFLQRD
ncbi:unnamed protein product [Allacma fusca]|uniref:Cyclic nucleotide phosphodiesterase catalytic domain-containing protein n=1 Tax=Allacma fusca TaxID=39272 RepID=A0A8J2LJD4_9HEXA|nr:unnamed protein product [Allacma fusca]